MVGDFVFFMQTFESYYNIMGRHLYILYILKKVKTASSLDIRSYIKGCVSLNIIIFTNNYVMNCIRYMGPLCCLKGQF